MGKFDGRLICTDLDGTLFRNDKTISEENKQAIEYFKREGGCFTFVTGRMPFFVSYALEHARPNVPIGCVDGGGLFDHVKGEYVWREVLSKNVLELVQYIDETVADVGIQVNTFDQTYFCRENDAMENFRKRTGVENLVSHYRDVQEPFAKILFGCEHEDGIRQIEALLRTHRRADEFDFIRSERTLFEILPKGITKGTSVTKLCEYLKLERRHVLAIGDYNNDVPMLRAAGVGIAVQNACREALEAADHITVSNEEHALARVICDLERGKFDV